MTITNENYVDTAEQVILNLYEKAGKKPTNVLTTSQLRKQLSMTAELFTQAQFEMTETLSAELQSKIEYLRIQFTYQAGREEKVKKFVTDAKILENLKDIGDSKKKFLLFCRYMEALVAYRKFHIEFDK